MEWITKLIEFLGGYPLWVKVFFVPIWFAILAAMLIWTRPISKDKTEGNAGAKLDRSGRWTMMGNTSGGNQQNNQVNAGTVNIYQGTAQDERDDLLITVPNVIGSDAIDKLYSELLFHNRGTRDFTIELMGCNAYEITKKDQQGRIITLWVQHSLEVIPAHKTTSKKVVFQSSAMEDLNEFIKKKFQIVFMCRMLDSDGKPHTTEVTVGELTMTGTNLWNYINFDPPIKTTYAPGSWSPTPLPTSIE